MLIKAADHKKIGNSRQIVDKNRFLHDLYRSSGNKKTAQSGINTEDYKKLLTGVGPVTSTLPMLRSTT